MNKYAWFGKVSTLSLTTVVTTALAVSTALAAPVNADEQYSASERAVQLAQENLIIDTHIDVPYRLDNNWDDVSKATEGGDFDYPRAVAGGLNVPFMSIYIPAQLNRLRAQVSNLHIA